MLVYDIVIGGHGSRSEQYHLEQDTAIELDALWGGQVLLIDIKWGLFLFILDVDRPDNHLWFLVVLLVVMLGRSRHCCSWLTSAGKPSVCSYIPHGTLGILHSISGNSSAICYRSISVPGMRRLGRDDSIEGELRPSAFDTSEASQRSHERVDRQLWAECEMARV